MALPDHPTQRKAAIKSFISSLTPWELLDLRRKLNNGTIPIRKHLAGLHHLPAEIISQIGLSLPIKDLLNCIQVSRSWSNAWTQPTVCRDICNYRFIGLLEVNDDPVPPAELAQVLCDACQNYLMKHGSPAALLSAPWSALVDANGDGYLSQHISVSDIAVEIGDGRPRIFFQNGFFALQTSVQTPKNEVYIGDFATIGVRSSRLTVGRSIVSGEMLELKGASKNMLVFMDVRSRTPGRSMLLVHLELREQKMLTLPAPCVACHVQNDTAVLVTQSGIEFIYAWLDNPAGKILNLGGPGCEESVDSQGRRIVTKSGVLFHPRIAGTVFLVWMRLGKPADAQNDVDRSEYTLEVTRYENRQQTWRGAKLVRELGHPDNEYIYHLQDLTSSTQEFRLDRDLFGWASISNGQSCQRASAMGLYVLVFFGVSPNKVRAGKKMLARGDMENMVWVAECFDTVNSRFRRLEYQLVSPAPWDSAAGTKYRVFRAWFYDDLVVLHVAMYPSSNSRPQYCLLRYRVCCVDGENVVPGINEQNRSGLWDDTMNLRKDDIHFFVSNDAVSVIFSAGGYHKKLPLP